MRPCIQDEKANCVRLIQWEHIDCEYSYQSIQEVASHSKARREKLLCLKKCWESIRRIWSANREREGRECSTCECQGSQASEHLTLYKTRGIKGASWGRRKRGGREGESGTSLFKKIYRSSATCMIQVRKQFYFLLKQSIYHSPYEWDTNMICFAGLFFRNLSLCNFAIVNSFIWRKKGRTRLTKHIADGFRSFRWIWYLQISLQSFRYTQ